MLMQRRVKLSFAYLDHGPSLCDLLWPRHCVSAARSSARLNLRTVKISKKEINKIEKEKSGPSRLAHFYFSSPPVRVSWWEFRSSRSPTAQAAPARYTEVEHVSLVLEQRRNKILEGTRGENRGGKSIGEESIICGQNVWCMHVRLR